MFGHTTACRSPALAFSATIHFAMKCSAPCSAVLRHSPSSWAAVVHWSALMPKALRSSRKHPIHSFPCPPHSPPPPPFLRTPRTSAVSYPPCAPQIPQTRSAFCVKPPRCSHFPSGQVCPDRKSGGRRYCAFANRCSESRTCGWLGAACRSGTRAGST